MITEEACGMILTAQEIYEKLSREYHIRDVTGFIRFNLGPHEMIVTTKDVVGNIIENWVKDWMEANDIEYEPNPNTQTKPDIYINPGDHTTGLLEIKAFDYSAAPNFDIADFKGLAKELLKRPYLLDVDALIFGYKMDINTGEVVVKDVWLRKLWELSRPSDKWPINVQYKNQIITKVRPATWYSSSGRCKYRTFETKEHFLSAFEETLYTYQDTHSMASDWKRRYQTAYSNHYGNSIHFPRWDEIKADYGFSV